ncbi:MULTISPECIES: hypothetical protein [unclassified Arthrobacter]|uniref:hypothetical protein n=1 Tax=unclassified Arthrobacter TaxID=235627 RepID=UPI001486A3C6|nr:MULTISPECIES: hypothetical protein [unclassified Arthrobacter]
MVEPGVGLVNDQVEPFLEGHAKHERLVLGLERLQHRGCTHLTELALGFGIDPAHLAPPA